MPSILKLLDLPRLALVAVFLALLVFLPVVDPDYFWHLTTGEYLLRHGLPATDMFSYTYAGTPWVLHEWLFEVVLYGAYDLLGGEFGVRLLVAGLAAATLAVMYNTARRLTGKPYVALLVVLGCFVLVKTGVSPRPQLVTLLLLAVYLRIMLGFRYFGETRTLLALPLLMVPWVNSHGGYVIGLAVLFFFLACEVLLFLATEKRDPLQRQRLQWLALAAAAAAIASLANPWFAGHWLYPFQVMTMEASRTYIGEWLSPDFHELVNKGYLLLLVAFCVLTAYRRDKPDLTEIAMPLVFLVMGFISVRHVPLAALAVSAFIAVALARQPVAAMVPAHWRARIAGAYTRRARQGNDLGDMEFVFNWLLLAMLVAATAAWYPVQQGLNAEKARESVPVGAVDFIEAQGISGRMFNTYHYGGYLIHRLYPAQQVFIDGRADMYGDAFVKEYGDIATGGPDWKTLFDRHRIDYVLVQRSQPLRQLLLAGNEFRLVYDDRTDSVLVRNVPAFAGIVPRLLPGPGPAGAAPAP